MSNFRPKDKRVWKASERAEMRGWVQMTELSVKGRKTIDRKATVRMAECLLAELRKGRKIKDRKSNGTNGQMTFGRITTKRKRAIQREEMWGWVRTDELLLKGRKTKDRKSQKAEKTKKLEKAKAEKTKKPKMPMAEKAYSEEAYGRKIKRTKKQKEEYQKGRNNKRHSF